MKTLVILFLVLFSGCWDLVDGHEIKIKKDIYAMHHAGIDGYSIQKKLSESGSTPIINALVVTINYDEDFETMVIKRVETMNSTDTIYLNYSVTSGNLDTISRDHFYRLKVKFKHERILLPPRK